MSINQLIANSHKISWLRSLPRNPFVQMTYTEKVVFLFGDSLLAYWVFGDSRGPATDYSGNSRDGTYHKCITGAGIGDGNNASIFNGSTSYVELYTDSLRDAFNGSEGSLSLWIKASSASIWSDGHDHSPFTLGTSMRNEIYIDHLSAGYILAMYRAGLVETYYYDRIIDANWHHYGFAWNKSINLFDVYRDGIQLTGRVGPASLGTWDEPLVDWLTIAGCHDLPFAAGWPGSIAHFAVGNKALPGNVLKNLYSLI